MHHLFQALEVAVMHVGLHEAGRGAHVDIAQRGYLELGIEFRSQPDPLRIWIQLAAIALQRAEKAPDAGVDEGLSRWISAKAALVGRSFEVILQRGISRHAEI